MSSGQEQIVDFVATARASNKLVLDSEQEQKREQQEQKYIEELQKKKQQKRQKREQAEKLEKLKLKIIQEKQKIYEKPEKMFQQDSDDGYQYKRVVKKIKRMFPELAEKYDHYGKNKKNGFIVNDAQDDQVEDQLESDGSSSGQQPKSSQKKINKNKKKQSKQREAQKRQQIKPEKKVEKRPAQKSSQNKVKIEPKTSSQKKQNLVKEVSVRWWYALPEWPPVDFDYKAKLKQFGYRIVDAYQFKSEADVIEGFQKALPIEGYRGIYKTKTKLLDIRPKQIAPTINNFRNMSTQELTSILKKALENQISKLKNVQYEQFGEKNLLIDLERQLIRLK